MEEDEQENADEVFESGSIDVRVAMSRHLSSL